MNIYRKVFVLLAATAMMAGCSYGAAKDEAKAGSVKIANPASVKCVEDGHRLEIRKDAEGNEYGVCIDKYGNECEEWKYFRGECKLSK